MIMLNIFLPLIICIFVYQVFEHFMLSLRKAANTPLFSHDHRLKRALIEVWASCWENMKFGSRKGWRCITHLRLKGKPATRFCLFPKLKSASYGPGHAPVYLNVYDLTPMNGYVYWAGLGIFHSGVEGKSTLHLISWISCVFHNYHSLLNTNYCSLILPAEY